MSKFKNGIGYYTKAAATVTVYFPEDEIRCGYCPWCRAEKELSRFWCRLCDKMVYDPHIPKLPDFCPLSFCTEADGSGELLKTETQED